MNIENLVISAGISLATVCGACGDTYTNFVNNGSEKDQPTDSGSNDPVEDICKDYIDCCAHVQDETARVTCYLTAGDKPVSTVSDCTNHLNNVLTPEEAACVAKSFWCNPTDAGFYSLGWKGPCGEADIEDLF